MKNFLMGVATVLTVAVAPLTGMSPAIADTPPAPSAMSYVVVPHPDDEWQAWSLIENSPANYKVFISMTEGEQSGYCDKPSGTVTPAPVAKWTDTCSQARLNSWLGFFTKMSATDPTIPGDWNVLPESAALPANGYTLRTDDGGRIANADRRARVAVDKQGRGAAIMFDLGDGDLTAKEVEWAVKAVLSNRATLGINTNLPSWNILGSFSHGGSYGSSCYVYPHPDHYAVHRVLYAYNFGTKGYQTAATCAGDSDVARTKRVTDKSINAAWSSTGAFKTSYGWLGGYALSTDQRKLFMAPQSFWQRY